MSKILALLVRHALTFVGGGTVIASDSEIERFVGAVLTIAGLIWSWYEKRPKAAPAQ